MSRQNNYAAVISRAIGYLSKKEKIEVAASKNNFPLKENIRCNLLDKDTLFSKIRSADIIIMPHGSTSMLEAFMLKKSVIFLPPQNWRQSKIKEAFGKAVSFYVSVDWQDIYNDIPSVMDWHNMAKINKRMAHDATLPRKIASLLEDKIELLKHKESVRKSLIDSQASFMQKIGYSDGCLTERILAFLRNIKK